MLGPPTTFFGALFEQGNFDPITCLYRPGSRGAGRFKATQSSAFGAPEGFVSRTFSPRFATGAFATALRTGAAFSTLATTAGEPIPFTAFGAFAPFPHGFVSNGIGQGFAIFTEGGCGCAALEGGAFFPAPLWARFALFGI